MGSVVRLRGLLAGAAFLVTSPASAERDVPWLEWSAPLECPSEAQIEERTASWYGNAPLPSTLHVVADLTWIDSLWHVSVFVDIEGQQGSRQLDFGTCSDAADFVALTAVLALRPGFSQESAARPFAAPGPEVASPTSPRSAEAPPVPAEPQRAPTQKAAAPATKPTPPPEDKPLPWFALGASGEWGSFPSWAGAVRADVGISYPKWSGALGVIGFPGVSAWPEEAASPIHYARVAGRFRLCRTLTGPKFVLAPCAGLELGAFLADQEPTTTGDRQEVVDIWVAGSISVEAGYPITPNVRFFGEVGLTVPFQAPAILLSDGTTVFRPAWAPSVSAGIRLIFGGSS